VTRLVAEEGGDRRRVAVQEEPDGLLEAYLPRRPDGATLVRDRESRDDLTLDGEKPDVTRERGAATIQGEVRVRRP